MYVVECRAPDGEVTYWRGDHLFVTDPRQALPMQDYAIAAPIASLVAMVCRDRDGLIACKYVPDEIIWPEDEAS